MRLRPGVFDPHHSHALVVATTTDLYILGIWFQNVVDQHAELGNVDCHDPDVFMVVQELARVGHPLVFKLFNV